MDLHVIKSNEVGTSYRNFVTKSMGLLLAELNSPAGHIQLTNNSLPLLDKCFVLQTKV